MSDLSRCATLAGAGLAALALVAASAAFAAPSRVCSLCLAGDEHLALLFPPERVVCVSSFADDAETSNVAGLFPSSVPRLAAQIEPVLAARPDLVVVAPWNDRGFVDLLARAKVPVFALPEANNFEEIAAATLALGRRLDRGEEAQRVVDEMNRRLATLDARLAQGRSQPRVLSFSHLIVAGKGTTVDALIRRAGGRNAAAEIGAAGHTQVPLERLIALDPDWLLLGFDPDEGVDRRLDAYPLLKQLRAVREGRVVVMSPRRLTAVSPFLVDGVEELARRIHPELFAGEGSSR